MLTVCLLTIISPICLSTVVNKGVSGCYGFIKEYVGTVAQSIIMIIAFALYKGMIGNIIETQVTGWESIWKLVVSTIVLVITVLSSQSIAKMLAGR
jgi:predicted Na+-dependent transporter